MSDLEIFNKTPSDTFLNLMQLDFIKVLVNDIGDQMLAKDLMTLSEISEQEPYQRKESVQKLVDEIANRSKSDTNRSEPIKRLSW